MPGRRTGRGRSPSPRCPGGWGRLPPPGPSFWAFCSSLFLLGEKDAKVRPQLRVLQRECDVGHQEPEFVARVVPDPLELVCEHPFPAGERSDRVGELDLPPRAGTGLHQGGEDGGGQDVPADDRQVRRRPGGLRFFDHVQHLVHPFRDPLPLYDAVPGDVFPGHPLDREDRVGAVSLVDVDHLAEHGNLRVDHVVGEDDGERLLADKVHGAENGMSQAEGHVLSHVEEVGHVGDRPDRGKLGAVPLLLQEVLQFVGDVEVVLDRVFSPSGHDDHVPHAGCARLLHAILDQRLVHEGQHLLGRRFRGREEPRPETCCRKHRLSYHRDFPSPASSRPARKRRNNSDTADRSRVHGIAGRFSRNIAPYPLVITPWSSRAITPKSSSLRRRRPIPCRSASTASGTWYSRKGSPPLSRIAWMRAVTTGSVGGAKGSLSITTQRSDSPGTSIPSQNVPVPIRTASASSRNALSRCIRGASPWTSSGCGTMSLKPSTSAPSVR